jgi:outer membrane biosynthesis protein TonB
MITGANTNIRYRGVVFHVQTEDSGRAYPHIISHLYHGGTILASEKTEYADQVSSADLEGIVRGLIEQQHREMVRKLQSGDFDAVIGERLGHDAIQPTGPVDTPTPIPEVTPVEAAPREPLPAPAPPPPKAVDVKPAASERPRNVARAFGDGIGSQRPLDEMILDYLSEKARERSAGRADTARKPNSSG